MNPLPKLVLSKIVFALLIAGQVFAMVTFPMRADFDMGDTAVQFLGFNFSSFDICFALALLLLLITFQKLYSQEAGLNKAVILVILLQCAYQIIIVVPLSLTEGSYSWVDIVRLLGPRLYMILIPFIYWLVLPAYSNIEASQKLIVYSSIILVGAGFLNFGSGNVFRTNTGELRLLWGGTAITFAFVMVVSIHFFSKMKSRFLLALLSIVGLVMANHRSAYLTVLLLVIVTMLGRAGKSARPKMYFGAFLFFAVALVAISEVPVLRENFFTRVASSADLTDPNAEVRIDRWAMAASYFLDHPLNGSMLKNEYYDSSIVFDFPPHNWIFEILATQGLIGFGFYLLMFLLIARIGLMNREDPVSWQMLLAVMFYLVFCLMNANFLTKWNVYMLAFPCAMILFRNKMLIGSPATLRPISVNET